MPKAARQRQTLLSDEGRYVTQTLPEVCMIVHMYRTGSGPDLGSETYAYHLETLQIALDNWEIGRDEDSLFDDAIYNLVKVTIEESKRFTDV